LRFLFDERVLVFSSLCLNFVTRFERHQHRASSPSSPTWKITHKRAAASPANPITAHPADFPRPTSQHHPPQTPARRNSPNIKPGLLEQKIRTQLREFLIHWCYAILPCNGNATGADWNSLALVDPIEFGVQDSLNDRVYQTGARRVFVLGRSLRDRFAQTYPTRDGAEKKVVEQGMKKGSYNTRFQIRTPSTGSTVS
jgi:hypothetical protein